MNTYKKEQSGGTVGWPFMLCTVKRLGQFSLHKMKIVFMGIYLLVLSQNNPTKLIVCIFGGLSIVPPLCSSLNT